MTRDLPTLLVARRPRQAGVDWTGARSWFGGAPRLGGAPWPRDLDGDQPGTPKHFAAQIDLAEVSAQAGAGIPNSGSLAFFFGKEGAVVHVPEGADRTPTKPPADTPDLSTYGGSTTWKHDTDGLPLFPFWPVELFRLNVPPPTAKEEDAANYEGQQAFLARAMAEVKKHVPHTNYGLSADHAFAGPPLPDWWQHAFQLASMLARAAEAGPTSLFQFRTAVARLQDEGGEKLAEARANVAFCEAKVAALHEANPGFRAYVAEVTAWVAGRDPWALMSQAEIEQLTAYWRRMEAFPELAPYCKVGELDWLKERTLIELPDEADPRFAAMPEAVQALVRQKRAPRPQWWRTAQHFTTALRAADTARNAFKDSPAPVFEPMPPRAAPKPAPRGFFAWLRSIFGSANTETANQAPTPEPVTPAEPPPPDNSPTEDAFDVFVRETEAWVAGRDIWARMAPEDVEILKSRLDRANAEFKSITRWKIPRRLDDYELTTLVALATGPDRAYASLPEEVRELINREYRLPGETWHQMFGRGVEIQDMSFVMRDEGYVMLLQLRYDPMMTWCIGDAGAYQWWISPEDLAAGNWDKVTMTAECH